MVTGSPHPKSQAVCTSSPSEPFGVNSRVRFFSPSDCILRSVDVIQAEHDLKLCCLHELQEFVDEGRGWFHRRTARGFVWLPGEEPTLGIVGSRIGRQHRLGDLPSSQHHLTLVELAVRMDKTETRHVTVELLGEESGHSLEDRLAIGEGQVGLPNSK